MAAESKGFPTSSGVGRLSVRECCDDEAAAEVLEAWPTCGDETGEVELWCRRDEVVEEEEG